MRTLLALFVLLAVTAAVPAGAASRGLPVPIFPVTFGLTVHVAAGAGTVTSAPAGIDCGATCAAAFPALTQVTLTATPAAGSSFYGWGGDCSGAQTTCTVSMIAARSVTATFDPARLTVNAQGPGGWVTSSGVGSPDGIDCAAGSTCTAPFPLGTTVTLWAIRSDVAALDSWSGCTSATSVLCTVTLTADTTVTAVFDPGALLIPVSVETDVAVTRSGAGSGEITMSPPGTHCSSACTRRYPVGVTLHVSVNASGGSTFSGWSGACAAASGTSCTVGVVPGLSFGASFAPQPSLAPSGSGGSGGSGSSGGSGGSSGSGGSGGSGGSDHADAGSGKEAGGGGAGPGSPAGDEPATSIAERLHARVVRRGDARRLEIALEVTRGATADVRLAPVRGGRALTRRAVVHRGRNVLAVEIPAGRAGRERLTVSLHDDAGNTQRLSAVVSLRR